MKMTNKIARLYYKVRDFFYFLEFPSPPRRIKYLWCRIVGHKRGSVLINGDTWYTCYRCDMEAPAEIMKFKERYIFGKWYNWRKYKGKWKH